jgi:putative NADH-flavin reductase
MYHNEDMSGVDEGGPLPKKEELPQELWKQFQDIFEKLFVEALPLLEAHDAALMAVDNEELEKTSRQIDNIEEQFRERFCEVIATCFTSLAQSDKLIQVGGAASPTIPEQKTVSYVYKLPEGFEFDCAYVKSHPVHDGIETYQEESWTLSIAPPASMFTSFGSNVLDNFIVQIDTVIQYPDPQYMVVNLDTLTDQKRWSLANAVRAFKQKQHL